MICDSCKEDKLVNDFINNQTICYQCVYRKKILKNVENRSEKPRFCRACKKEVIIKKELKKRQRTVFCCQECALAGHKEIKKNYWCRKVPNIRFGDAFP